MTRWTLKAIEHRGTVPEGSLRDCAIDVAAAGSEKTSSPYQETIGHYKLRTGYCGIRLSGVWVYPSHLLQIKNIHPRTWKLYVRTPEHPLHALVPQDSDFSTSCQWVSFTIRRAMHNHHHVLSPASPLASLTSALLFPLFLLLLSFPLLEPSHFCGVGDSLNPPLHSPVFSSPLDPLPYFR